MARFRYSLQSILNIKMKMEDQAKQEFSVARNVLDEEEEKLAALKERKSFYVSEARRLLSGILDFRAIEENKQFQLIMEDYIDAQKERVRLAERQLDDARQRLAEVMMERKTHETLREKAFELYIQEENRAESKIIDELTSYTYGQKKA